MKIRCITVDDEPLALKQMVSYIERTPFLELVAACSNATDALNEFHEQAPDLIFADINMPHLSGMELVKLLQSACMIIFTTAYSEYALEGFKVDAVDYLLKPIGYADFLKAANKAKKLYDLQRNNEPVAAENDNCLYVNADRRLVRINFQDIRYIEGMREYVRIHLKNGSSVMPLLGMKSLEDRLPKEQFMRVHRSFIINLEEITAIERSRIVFDKDTFIPIGDQYKEAFHEYIGKKFL